MEQNKGHGIDLIHIYAGTRGAMGLYLHEIYLAFQEDLRQECVVSWDFPFDYGHKWFYRWTDISKFRFLIKYNFLRRLLRAIELLVTLCRSFLLIYRNKPVALNYGLTSDTFLELGFVLAVKYFTNTRIIITAHDVLPFGERNSRHMKWKIVKKKMFFDTSDNLILHNSNSIKDLYRFFGQEYSIISFPFPIMDLNLLPLPLAETFSRKKQGIFRISMVGNFRKEKGLDILIGAWDSFRAKYQNAELVIAGYVPDAGTKKLLNERDDLLWHDNFLSDSDYRELIKTSDVVVLPYRRGSNSGIPSSVLTQNTLLVTSDIDMFKSSPLLDEGFLFKEGHSYQLYLKLEWIYKMTNSQRTVLINENRDKVYQYRKDFYLLAKKEVTGLLGTI